MIKIVGDKGKINITFDDKVVRFYGDLGSRKFFAETDTMIFIEPKLNNKPSKEEIVGVIKEIRRSEHRKNIIFFNEKGKEYSV